METEHRSRPMTGKNGNRVLDEAARAAELSRTQKRSGSNHMDGTVGGGSGGGIASTNLWWALASVSQIGWGISSYTRGYAGDSRFMPFKAFVVASLFVGGVASASVGVLQYNGIRKVEDVMEVGANIRAGLGLPPRVQDESS